MQNTGAFWINSRRPIEASEIYLVRQHSHRIIASSEQRNARRIFSRYHPLGIPDRVIASMRL